MQTAQAPSQAPFQALEAPASPLGLQPFYDTQTGAVSYVLWERASARAAFISAA